MNQLVPISSPTLPALVAAASERVSAAAREEAGALRTTRLSGSRSPSAASVIDPADPLDRQILDLEGATMHSVSRTGKIVIDLAAHAVSVEDQPLHLTDKEYAILELLSLRKGIVVSKEMILDHLYGGMDEPEAKIIDVFFCKLRKKLALATGGEHHIKTVWAAATCYATWRRPRHLIWTTTGWSALEASRSAREVSTP